MIYVISLISNLRKRKVVITIFQYDWIVTMQLAA
jgi:hypothetical protein